MSSFSASSVCECEYFGCSNVFEDRCDDCNLSLCNDRVYNHNCGNNPIPILPIITTSIPILDHDDVNNKYTYTNTLKWWKAHQKDLPILSRLAHQILCISATSAPSERVFSMAGLTISNLHASLSAENASALIYLHDTSEIAEQFQCRRAMMSGGPPKAMLW